MSKFAGEAAANYWEVERQSCGQTFRPYYLVVLRNKKNCGQTVVKAVSSDSHTVSLYVEQLRRDLCELTNEEFVSKYDLDKSA
jgi:hypothetical protein